MTRWVLAAVVIRLSCMGLATSPLRFVSRRTGLRKRPILSCLKAVNPQACAPQYTLRTSVGSGAKCTANTFKTPCKGPKVVLGLVSRGCYLGAKPSNPAKFGEGG